jgi:hypothetical protein
VNPRGEPLLWLQLIAVGLLPLEALLLLLLLAGSDPGPVPGIERVLCWAIGVLAPALLLWRRPADVWSLLLVQTPLRARRNLQQRLSTLQEDLPPKLGLAIGAALALPLLWWLDRNAAMASAFSPLAGGPRVVALLLASLVLALMLWQWQQILQTLWLLSRSPAVIAAAPAMDQTRLEGQRLSLGIPLLLPDPLHLPELVIVSKPPQATEPFPAPPPAPSAGAQEHSPEEESTQTDAATGSAGAPVAVEPEKPCEDGEGGELDQQVG